MGMPTHAQGEGWLTACGWDRANVVRWTDDPSQVTCRRCLAKITPAAEDTPDADIEVPDHPYFGNLCTGFGGESRCLLCGKPEAAHRMKHPYPCPTEGCPGNSRYAPPGRGHIDGCTYLYPPVSDQDQPAGPKED